MTEPLVLMKRHLHLVFVAMLLILSGCGARDLSRSEAKEMLLSSENIKTLEKTVAVRWGEKAELHGLFQDHDAIYYKNLTGQQSLLSRAPSSPFGGPQSVSAYILSDNPVEVDVQRLEPQPSKNKLTLKLEITGILTEQEGSAARTVFFSWAHEGLSPILKLICIEGGTGNASFLRMDDGWRLENVQVDPVGDHPDLSEDEMQVLENYRTLYVEFLEEGIRQAEQRRAKVIKDFKEANSDHKTLFQSRYHPTSLRQGVHFYIDGRAHVEGYDIAITDASIWIRRILYKWVSENNWHKVENEQVRIPFANISKFMAGTGGARIYVFCQKAYPFTDDIPEGMWFHNHFFAEVRYPKSKGEQFQKTLDKAFGDWKKQNSSFYGTDWMWKAGLSKCR